MISRATVEQMLMEGICLVEFNKSDGSGRSMPCTLKPGLIPPPKVGSTGSIVSEGLVVVWCIDKQAWRSFRLDRLKSIRLLDQRK